MSVSIDPAWLLALVLTIARILSWAMIAPPIATAGLPRQVTLALSVALALAVLPITEAHVPPDNLASVASALVVQIGLGSALGFITRLVLAAVESAGNLLDLFAGFSVASVYNPMSNSSTSIFGGFYGLICTTLLFVTNAHQIVIEGFLRSFHSIPLDAGFSMQAMSKELSGGITDLFVSALQIVAPMVVVLFLADMCLGLLNRIAPQLNAFSLSFPVKIALTLGLAGAGLWMMPQTVAQLATKAGNLVANLV